MQGEQSLLNIYLYEIKKGAIQIPRSGFDINYVLYTNSPRLALATGGRLKYCFRDAVGPAGELGTVCILSRQPGTENRIGTIEMERCVFFSSFLYTLHTKIKN